MHRCRTGPFPKRILAATDPARTAEGAPFGSGTVPLNVATICALTFQCALHDIHPNGQGYDVIASAFEAVISATPS